MEDNYARDLFEAMRKQIEALAVHLYGEDEIDFVDIRLRPDGFLNISVYGKDDADGKYTCDEVVAYGLFNGITAKERGVYERSISNI